MGDYNLIENIFMHDHQYSLDPGFKIDPDQIQIKADASEIDRRIKSFIARKREQVNLFNNQRFCMYSGQSEDDDSNCTCARVNAVALKGKDSKSHIKVYRAFNQWSHQNSECTSQGNVQGQENIYTSALEERLSTSENILGLNKPVPKNVYERLKKIEDRLLFLESVSPEYKDLWVNDDCDSLKSLHGDSTVYDMKKFNKRRHSEVEDNSDTDEISSKVKRIR